MVKHLKLILLAFIILLIDQLTKFLFQYKNFTVIPKIFLIKYNQNPGLIFGLFSNYLFFTIFIPTLVILFFIYYCLKQKDLKIQAAITLITVGLLGNLIDRIRLGYVIDFIFIPIWPKYNISLFNIADASLIIGIFLLIYYLQKQ